MSEQEVYSAHAGNPLNVLDIERQQGLSPPTRGNHVRANDVYRRLAVYPRPRGGTVDVLVQLG